MQEEYSLTPRQAGVLLHVLGALPIEQSVHVLQNELKNSTAGQLTTCYAPFEDDPEVRIIFSLPMASDIVLLMLSDGDPDELSRAIQTIEEIFIEKSRDLDLGSIIRLSGPYLQANHKAGAVLLYPSVFDALKSLEEPTTVEGERIQFVLVMLITLAECETRRNQGHDALTEMVMRRDTVSISST